MRQGLSGGGCSAILLLQLEKPRILRKSAATHVARGGVPAHVCNYVSVSVFEQLCFSLCVSLSLYIYISLSLSFFLSLSLSRLCLTLCLILSISPNLSLSQALNDQVLIWAREIRESMTQRQRVLIAVLPVQVISNGHSISSESYLTYLAPFKPLGRMFKGHLDVSCLNMSSC